MNKLGEDLPWPLSFSYGRALQSSALVAWGENMDDTANAQSKLLERAKANSDATIN
jgi:fructose-bisphosphate aldolase class I